MPFTPADPDRICVALKDFTLRADLLVNLPRYETEYGGAYSVTVQALLTNIETLSGNISVKETEFAQNSVQYNLGSSQLAPGVTVGNLKKVGAIEYYNSDSYSSYTKTLAEMKAQLDALLTELAKLLRLSANHDCNRRLIR